MMFGCSKSRRVYIHILNIPKEKLLPHAQIEFLRRLLPFLFLLLSIPCDASSNPVGRAPSSFHLSRASMPALYPMSTSSSNLLNCIVPYYDANVSVYDEERYLNWCPAYPLNRRLNVEAARSSLCFLQTCDAQDAGRQDEA